MPSDEPSGPTDPDEPQEITSFLSSTVTAPDEASVPLLEKGDISVIGRMPYSSNATFLVDVCRDDQRTQAIYKPERGERPLHDFEPGLWRREVASYLVSERAGWGVVPPTLAREGPLGVGSVQFFCPSDYSEHYFTIAEAGHHEVALRRLCALDIVINNTDRKSGHVLLGNDGNIWAIDNGLSFHVEPKLRTVIWDFAGSPIGDDIASEVTSLAEPDLGDDLADLLEVEEIEAVFDRAERLVATGTFPVDRTGRAYPWPLV